MEPYSSRRDQPWSLRSCFREKFNQNVKQWYFLRCAVSCRLTTSRSLGHVRHFVSLHMIKICVSVLGPIDPTGGFAPFALRIYVFNVNVISISFCTLHYVCLWNVMIVIRMAIKLIWFDLIQHLLLCSKDAHKTVTFGIQNGRCLFGWCAVQNDWDDNPSCPCLVMQRWCCVHSITTVQSVWKIVCFLLWQSVYPRK